MEPERDRADGPAGHRHVLEPAAERLFDYTAEEAIGRHIDDLVATDASVRSPRPIRNAGMSGELVH